ncbi:MAG: diacylglycerol kinase [Alphaproteobacteria bacterium]|jgi:diacylglycerol kinase (ATP)|nr:diacylglycerol kinase [Alphaproteobacteria bacterium]
MNTIKHIFYALKNSLNGLSVVFKNEVAFRQDLLIVVIGYIVLPFLHVGMLAKCLLGFSLVTILIAELVNTAIENVVDRIGHEYHELSKNAKDIGSAIVMVTLTAVFCLWGCVILLA